MSVKNGKSIGILTFEAWHNREQIGSSRLRGHWLINHWPEAELFQQGAKYEAIIFQKVYWLEYAKAFKGIKILDICDPDWLDTLPVRDVMDECDAITVSSEGLKEAIEQFVDKPVIFIPDRQDLDFHNKQKKHEGIAKSVIWFGYGHNSRVLDPCVSTLKKCGLKLTVLSDCRPPYVKAFKNVKYEWENPDWSFNDLILQHDFVVLPPDERPRGKFKSTNKTLTAWALGMPVARTREDVLRFIDPDERNKEAEARLKEVRERYDIKQSVEEFKNLIEKIKNDKR